MTNLVEQSRQRPRRLRASVQIRNLVAETSLKRDMFVFPVFIVPGHGIQRPIKALTGMFHYSADMLLKEVETLMQGGLSKFLLFGTGEKKTEDGSSAWNAHSAASDAVRLLKSEFASDIFIATDVCLCSYTTHGHCGLMAGGQILNDESSEVLSKMALAHAQAGADLVAPSDMMDGRIGVIRDALDRSGFEQVSIMAYAAKFASGYYGPFRDAADCAPQGDRKTYQMDFRNRKESIKEVKLDESEGADIIMIKPALVYLDVIAAAASATHLPVACYNVSGEYAMVKAAAAAGLIDERQVIAENMTAFARAGASVIVTYHIKDMIEQDFFKP